MTYFFCIKLVECPQANFHFYVFKKFKLNTFEDWHSLNKNFRVALLRLFPIHTLFLLAKCLDYIPSGEFCVNLIFYLNCRSSGKILSFPLKLLSHLAIHLNLKREFFSLFAHSCVCATFFAWIISQVKNFSKLFTKFIKKRFISPRNAVHTRVQNLWGKQEQANMGWNLWVGEIKESALVIFSLFIHIHPLNSTVCCCCCSLTSHNFHCLLATSYHSSVSGGKKKCA